MRAQGMAEAEGRTGGRVGFAGEHHDPDGRGADVCCMEVRLMRKGKELG